MVAIPGLTGSQIKWATSADTDDDQKRADIVVDVATGFVTKNRYGVTTALVYRTRKDPP